MKPRKRLWRIETNSFYEMFCRGDRPVAPTPYFLEWIRIINPVFVEILVEAQVEGKLTRKNGSQIRELYGTVDRGRTSVRINFKPKWRNWQTRYVQGVVSLCSWGFKSPLRHGSCRTIRLAGVEAATSPQHFLFLLIWVPLSVFSPAFIFNRI